MNYKNEVMIFNELGLELRTHFDDYVDNGEYVVIDKEKLAQAIIDENEEKLQQDDCDISMLVYNDISEIVSDVSGIIDELINNNG